MSLLGIARPPYVVRLLVEYVRSLLDLQILPHKVLQCFVFDLCLYFGLHHLLQQLLHYHVLLDSEDVCRRLFAVMQEQQADAGHWATQQGLDMAQRLHLHDLAVQTLVECGRYLDVLPYLRAMRVLNFPLAEVFTAADPCLFQFLK